MELRGPNTPQALATGVLCTQAPKAAWVPGAAGGGAGGLLALCASSLLVARPKGAKQGRSQWNSADLLCGEELDEGKLSRPVLN